MAAFLLGRLGQAVIVLLAVAFIAFLLLHLSGDPAVLLLPPDATRAQVIEFRQQMGFDQPFLEQYLRFMQRLLAGDLGYSWRYQQPVLPLVIERIPATLYLAVTALYVFSAFAVNRIMTFIEKRSRVPGLIAASGGGH